MPYPDWMRRIIHGALIVGVVSGGFQGYRRLTDSGWGRSAALLVSVCIAGILGALLWNLVA